jgi:hypothetical protein
MAEGFLKDYIPVSTRIEEFWQKYPQGRIATSIYSWENGTVVVRAETYRDIKDQVPAATGHAHEVEGTTYINKTSALENCETSAVGRALAIMGFEIKGGIASQEEVEGAKARGEGSAPQGQAPRPTSAQTRPAAARPTQTNPTRERNWTTFWPLMRKAFGSDDETRKFMQAEFNKTDALKLTDDEYDKMVILAKERVAA